MKSLNEDFGLRYLVNYVKKDNTLDIEIREDCINIYYRGGNALKVKELGVSRYNYHFDKEYLMPASSHMEVKINESKSESDWDNYFPEVKQSMDFYFTKHMKEEREYQQIVVRENSL